MLVLGIESSCDESSAALVRDGREVLSNVIASQINLHSRFGGVVPELAARAHLEAIMAVVSEALSATAESPELIAVTAGPGLVGSLVVGMSVAKGLAWSWGVPLVPVNHVEAHAFAPQLEGGLPPFPFLGLVVSGGHTVLMEVAGVDRINVIGQTLDDALGEAYDKISKHLGLGYPGGPVIDRLALNGDPTAVRFPRAMIGSGDYNLSFSGLKTAVVRYIRENEDDLPPTEDLVASFQAAALEVVVKKTVGAALEHGLFDIVIGGGVACNSALRSGLAKACDKEGINLFLPPPSLCTDNAAMIAALGYERFRLGRTGGMELDVYPGLAIGGLAQE